MYDSVLTNPNYDLDKAEFNTTEKTSIDNLRILGGIDGLCLALKVHKVEPDYKFFNTMLLVGNYILKKLNMALPKRWNLIYRKEYSLIN